MADHNKLHSINESTEIIVVPESSCLTPRAVGRKKDLNELIAPSPEVDL